MIHGILGRKIKQTQRFTKEGKRIPVTIIEAGPCPIVYVKTRETDGYAAVQLGFGSKKAKHVSKPIQGHSKKAGLNILPRFLQELKLAQEDIEGNENIKQGTVINVNDVFQTGDMIKITGVSKGKGFAGVVKRHGFHGGPRTHGQSDRERAPGSIGQTTTPGRVYKGKKMAGRMGTDTVTIKNLQVIEINKAKNILIIKGLIPGARNSIVKIIKA